MIANFKGQGMKIKRKEKTISCLDLSSLGFFLLNIILKHHFLGPIFVEAQLKTILQRNIQTICSNSHA
jgi:hypothetical protein